MEYTKAGVTVVVLVGVLALLMFSSLGADAVLLAGLVVVLVTGVIDARTAVLGFANEGVLTVAALFIVAAGVRQTGGALMDWLKHRAKRFALAHRPNSGASSKQCVSKARAQLMVGLGIRAWFRRRRSVP